MNCPSRTDPELPDEWNQSPNALSSGTTTRSDWNRIANARRRQDHKLKSGSVPHVELLALNRPGDDGGGGGRRRRTGGAGGGDGVREEDGDEMLQETLGTFTSTSQESATLPHAAVAAPTANVPLWRRLPQRTAAILINYSKFVGPGFMISVAYIDPGNYATDVAAGATYRFRLLFMVLVSNLFAIFLQSLCIKLGSVTGLNLAEMCKAHLPPWLNYTLYVFAECAIIATDIAEVIGTAIALNLLSSGKIPLVVGCAVSILDVLFILFFYRPNDGSMRALRIFEAFVALLVLGVVICFCFQLSLIQDVNVAEVFRGYLPSSALVQGHGLYQACGILGATVMPHSLYLGSGIIQTRLKEFDEQHGLHIPAVQQLSTPSASHATSRSTTTPRPSTSPSSNPVSQPFTIRGDPASLDPAEEDEEEEEAEEKQYRPSLPAIKHCMHYSITELALSLFTFALFVNSAILIVAGASLSTNPDAATATLFGIHDLLSSTLAPAAGTIFALALLLSGTSAGIVCTIAGQMVSEGALRWRMKPWLRRLMTRSISITPSIIVAGALGKEGVSAALTGSQFALSVILPFVSAPLIYFTCRAKYMTVGGATGGTARSARSAEAGSATRRRGTEDEDDARRAEGTHDGVVEAREIDAAPPSLNGGGGDGAGGDGVQMANNWVTATFAVLIWGVVVVMNVASLVLVGLGVS